MSYDDGWDADPEQSQPATAQDMAGVLKARCITILAASGHRVCDLLDGAHYRPDSGAVICGCGQFAPWSDDPDRNPPWESSTAENDAVHRGMQAAQEQRETLESGGLGLPAPGHPKGGALTYEAQDPIRSTLALIDPTEMYTPDDVERHILDTLYRLETGQLFERASVEKFYAAKQAFDLKYAACMVSSKGGAADVRKAQATVDCAQEYAALNDAEMVLKAVKATMHNLRSVITGYQSVAKSVAQTYQAGGSQGAPPQRERSPW